MRTYETVFILNPELNADTLASQIEFYKDNITKNGGEILTVEPWGKLTLAYKIDKFTEGNYVLIQFKAAMDYVVELEKRFKYNEDIMRYVVVMIDEKKFKLKPRKDSARKDRRPRSDDQTALEGENDTESTMEDIEEDVEMDIKEQE